MPVDTAVVWPVVALVVGELDVVVVDVGELDVDVDVVGELDEVLIPVVVGVPAPAPPLPPAPPVLSNTSSTSAEQPMAAAATPANKQASRRMAPDRRSGNG
jgi:hypothetical protein